MEWKRIDEASYLECQPATPMERAARYPRCLCPLVKPIVGLPFLVSVQFRVRFCSHLCPISTLLLIFLGHHCRRRCRCIILECGNAHGSQPADNGQSLELSMDLGQFGGVGEGARWAGAAEVGFDSGVAGRVGGGGGCGGKE